MSVKQITQGDYLIAMRKNGIIGVVRECNQHSPTNAINLISAGQGDMYFTISSPCLPPNCGGFYMFDSLGKVCPNCKVSQSLVNFHKNRSSKDGYQHHCISCRRQFHKNYPEGKEKRLLNTPEEFWSLVNKTDTCWLWVGVTRRSGYGQFYLYGKQNTAHRLAYILVKGSIPEGLQLDHLCRVRNCVNPDHLEAVTPKENVLRGFSVPAMNARKTHCPKGHEFTPENTILLPTYGKVRGIGRRCRTCHNERRRKGGHI